MYIDIHMGWFHPDCRVGFFILDISVEAYAFGTQSVPYALIVNFSMDKKITMIWNSIRLTYLIISSSH